MEESNLPTTLNLLRPMCPVNMQADYNVFIFLSTSSFLEKVACNYLQHVMITVHHEHRTAFMISSSVMSCKGTWKLVHYKRRFYYPCFQ